MEDRRGKHEERVYPEVATEQCVYKSIHGSGRKGLTIGQEQTMDPAVCIDAPTRLTTTFPRCQRTP